MRISDWSSDVCSSDLYAALAAGESDRLLDLAAVEGLSRRIALHHGDLAPLDALEGGEARTAAFAFAAAADCGVVLGWSRDRQSGVEGQSVSVRVEPGGRAVNKDKQNDTTHTQV